MKPTVRVAMNDARVRQVKRLLIAGHRVADLARFFEVSPETISRIKRGATHRNVIVEGEAKLKPANPLEEVPEGQTVPRGLTEVMHEEMNATLAKLMKVQEELDRPVAAPVGQSVSREALDAEAAKLREEEVRRAREEAKREGAGYGE